MLSLKSSLLLSSAILLAVITGATLASPLSAELLQYMKTIITVNNHNTPYFIGFKARNNTDFSSEEGILLEDAPAAFDMVEQIDPVEGDCLCMDGHTIRIESCSSRLPFICYTDETAAVDTTTTEVSATKSHQCDDPEYKMYPMGCYKVHSNWKSWVDANSTCTAEGAHLVVINDNAEATVIIAILNEYGLYSTWVGLRKVEGTHDWVAVTGERQDEVYHVWCPRDPRSLPCGDMESNGLLGSWYCAEPGANKYICEK